MSFVAIFQHFNRLLNKNSVLCLLYLHVITYISHISLQQSKKPRQNTLFEKKNDPGYFFSIFHILTEHTFLIFSFSFCSPEFNFQDK